MCGPPMPQADGNNGSIYCAKILVKLLLLLEILGTLLLPGPKEKSLVNKLRMVAWLGSAPKLVSSNPRNSQAASTGVGSGIV